MNEGYKDPLQGTNGGIDLVAALFGPHLFLITQLRLGWWSSVEEKKEKCQNVRICIKFFRNFPRMWDMHAYAHSTEANGGDRRKRRRQEQTTKALTAGHLDANKSSIIRELMIISDFVDKSRKDEGVASSFEKEQCVGGAPSIITFLCSSNTCIII